MDVFWSLPPVTRTITALAVAVSCLGYGRIINFGYYIFVTDYVFTIKIFPQLWRIFTAFFITKKDFGILYDPYFLYQYGSGLERESSRFSQPGDFFVYTLFVGSLIVGLAGVVVGGYAFLPALTLAYAYTFAQDQPNRGVSFFIITFEAKYLPYALLFMTFIIDSPSAAKVQFTGLIAAHMYEFLTRIWPTFGGGKNYIFTPQLIKKAFGAKGGNVQKRDYGQAIQGRTQLTDPGSTGRSTGIGNSWNSAGPGRRLGGE